MITGSCVCGQVRYEIRGQMGAITHCHCPTCRKAHASAFSSVSRVGLDDLVFTAGQQLLKFYESSPGKKRYFCSNCGSQIYARREDQNHYLFRMGTIDGDPGVRPAQHIFTADKALWYNIHDNIPEYSEWALNSPTDSSASSEENEKFHTAMQAMLTQAIRHDTSSSLLLFELHGDTQQHISGILQHEIRSNIRCSDAVEILGESEYAVLLPYTNTAASMVLTERILNAMRSKSADAAFSIGVATIHPDQLSSIAIKQNIQSIISMAKTAANHARQEPGTYPAANHFDRLD
jgi:hypothetical protein